MTKLFKLYEETESENNNLKKELNEWQEWFSSNEEIFNKLFTSADHLRKNVVTSSASVETETPEVKEVETKETKKNRKRLRFKK